VRHRERTHLERAHREAVVAVEAVDAVHAGEALADDGHRAEGQPHGDAVLRRERGDAADVVGVLVRDDDRVDVARREAEAAEARRGVAHAEAAVDHDARGARLDDEPVAFAAAPQRREAHQPSRIT
jgi:hypothetical protein